MGWLVGKNPDVFKGLTREGVFWQGNEGHLKNVGLSLKLNITTTSKLFVHSLVRMASDTVLYGYKYLSSFLWDLFRMIVMVWSADVLAIRLALDCVWPILSQNPD